MLRFFSSTAVEKMEKTLREAKETCGEGDFWIGEGEK